MVRVSVNEVRTVFSMLANVARRRGVNTSDWELRITPHGGWSSYQVIGAEGKQIAGRWIGSREAATAMRGMIDALMLVSPAEGI